MEIEGRQFSFNRLKRYRKLSGFKQETVKRKLGLGSRSILSDWENGKKFPPLPRLYDLADLYRCKPLDLYPDLDIIPVQSLFAPLETFDECEKEEEN